MRNEGLIEDVHFGNRQYDENDNFRFSIFKEQEVYSVITNIYIEDDTFRLETHSINENHFLKRNDFKCIDYQNCSTGSLAKWNISLCSVLKH